jgi:hypothetical protein
MADRYWVGGTGTWNTTTTHWSATSGGTAGATAPTIADNVIFDAGSNVTTEVFTVTVSGNVNCLNLTVGAVDAVMTLAGGSTANIFIYGSLSYPATNLVASMSGTYEFGSSTTGKTITTNGVSIVGDISFNGIGGGWTLTDDLTVTGASGINLNDGTFSTGNFAVTTTTFTITGSATRTLTLGSSIITCTSAYPTYAWNANVVTGLTFTANTATIILSAASTAFIGGTLTYNIVNITNTSNGTHYFSGVCTIGSMTIASPAATGVKTISFATNMTITTLVASGASIIRRLQFVSSSTTASSKVLTIGTWTTKTDIDFKGITASGTAWSGTRLGNAGNNVNITFVASKTVYWNLAGTVLWSAIGWATTSGGTPSINNFPLAQDIVIFDNTGAAGTVTIDGGWLIGQLNMSARTSAMTLGATSSFTLLGNVTLGTNVTLTGTVTATLGYNSALTLTTNGRSIPWAMNCEGNVTLSGGLTCTNILSASQTISTFNAGANSVTVLGFTGVGSGTINMGSSLWTITGGGTASSPCWEVINVTLNCETANILLSNNGDCHFSSSNHVYNKLTFGGSGTPTAVKTLSGNNTFSEIASTIPNSFVIAFNGSYTIQVGAFSVTGSPGNIVTIGDISGSVPTFNYTGGTYVSSDYLNITHSNATPANKWWAGNNSINSGVNTGWIFSSPTFSSGLFFGSNF